MENNGTDKKWSFPGTPGQFITLVKMACVGYELYKQGRSGVLHILMDKDEYEKTAEEFGITFDAVLEEVDSAAFFIKSVDKVMKEIDGDNQKAELKEETVSAVIEE